MLLLFHSLCWRILCVLLLSAIPGLAVQGHGNVSLDDDLCVIEIGYFRAHFKVYLPQEKGHRQFCEDFPLGEHTIFVMEYMHGDLAEVPLSLRIIRNTTGQGRYTNREDIDALGELQDLTVFHQPAERSADVFMASHRFQEKGEYVGIVSAEHPDTAEPYIAVFPFTVGYTPLGYLPLFVLLLIVLQVFYWISQRPRRRSVPTPGVHHESQ